MTFIPSPIVNTPHSNVIEGASLTIQNVLAGAPLTDMSRGFLQPETLTPEERKRFSERLGLTGPMKALVDVATNPMVILGAFLSMRAPVQKASDLFEIPSRVKRLARQVGPLDHAIGTPDQIFREQPHIANTIYRVIEERNHLKTLWNNVTIEAQEQASKILGKNFSRTHHELAGLYMEGAHKHNSLLNRVIRSKSKLPDSTAPILNLEAIKAEDPNLLPAIEKFVAVERKGYNDIWKTAATELREQLLEHGRKSGIDDTQLREVISQLKPKKGEIPLGAFVTDYLPHIVKSPKNLLPKSLVNEYGYQREMFSRNRRVSTPGRLRERSFSMPDRKEMEGIEKFLDADSYSGYTGIINQGPASLKEKTYQIVDMVGQFNPQTVPAKFRNRYTQMLIDDFNVPDDVAVAQTEKLTRVIAEQTDKFTNFGPRTRTFESLLDEQAFTLGTVPTYTINAIKAKEGFVHSMAPAYVMDTPIKGTGLKKGTTPRQAFETFAKSYRLRGDQVRAQILEGDYVPLLMGTKTFREWKNAAAFNGWKLNAVNKLRSPNTAEWMDKIPGGRKARESLIRTVSNEDSALRSNRAIQNTLTGAIYHGALGFNVASATQNMLQSVISTAPMFGLDSTSKGVSRVVGQIPRLAKTYNKLRRDGKASNIAFEGALRDVFPDFAKRELHSTGQFAELIEAGNFKESPLARGLEKFNRVGMSLFTGTETFNRLVAFETAMVHGLKDPTLLRGLSPAKALADKEVRNNLTDLAARVVRTTQFSGGRVSTPRGLLNVPGPIRQFATFPIRYAGFLAESPNYGSNAIGKNLGTIGRAMMYSGGAYELAKNLAEVDISRGLMFGALPEPREHGPFAPFPFVPPAVDIVGSGIQALTSDDERKKKGFIRSLAPLAPGGVALSRAYRTLAPRYADYSELNQTGKVSTYDDEGNKISRLSYVQLMAKAAGIKTWSNQQEVEVSKFLLSQRDQMRELRNQYLQAMASNDYDQAKSIQAEWERKWPGMGGLQVKASDIRRLHERQEMTRIERVLKQFNEQQRQFLEPIVGMARAQTDISTLVNSPELLRF